MEKLKIKQSTEWIEFCGCGCGDGSSISTLVVNGVTIKWGGEDTTFTKLEVVSAVRRHIHLKKKNATI